MKISTGGQNTYINGTVQIRPIQYCPCWQCTPSREFRKNDRCYNGKRWGIEDCL